MRSAMLLGILSLPCLPLLPVSPMFSASLWAQDDGDSTNTGPGDVIVAWRAFREAAGEDWKLVWNRAGLAAELSGTPLTVDAANRTQAARQLLARHATLFALDVAGMSLGDAREDEAQDGSSVVRFGVLYRALPVLGAHVSVHFDRAGRVRAVLAHTTPIDVRKLDAGIDTQRVKDVIAARHLEREVQYVAEPTLAVIPARAGGRLVYRCQVCFDPPLLGVAGEPPKEGEEPAVWRVLVDAHSGRIVGFGAG